MAENEYRRTKKKLALFEQEALSWVLSDIMDEVTDICTPLDESVKATVIEHLRKKYQKYLDGDKYKESRQQSLF
jgi:phage-related protein